MTATTVKSTIITNSLDGLPPTHQATSKLGGNLHASVDTIEAATTSLDELNDVILMLPLASELNLLSLKLFNDDLDTGGTAGTVNIGLYNGPRAFVDGVTKYAAYQVLDADCFATIVTTLTAANTAGVEVRFEAGAGVAGDIADVGKRLWEIAGLAADPKRDFVIGLTVVTPMTTPAAGTISLIAQHML